MPDKPDLGADGPAALARRTQDAKFRGNVVARTVAAEALEALHAMERIDDDMYAAGCRLRRAYASSWQGPRWTGGARYASDGSELDELAETSDPEAYQRHCHELWTTAQRAVGFRWAATLFVCGFTGEPNLAFAREGLSILAGLWKDKKLD